MSQFPFMSWIVADLAIHLTSHNEFNFNGIEHEGEVMAHDVKLASIRTDASNPLTAAVDPDVANLAPCFPSALLVPKHCCLNFHYCAPNVTCPLMY